MAADEQRVPHSHPHPSRLEQDEEPGPDVSVLKEIGRKALIDSLNSVRFSRLQLALPAAQMEREADFLLKVNGAKTLVLDNSIAGPLGLVTDVSLLKVSPNSPLTIRLTRPDVLRKAPWSRQNVLARAWSADFNDI